MLSLNFVKENSELVRANLKKRNLEVKPLEEVLALDKKWR